MKKLLSLLKPVVLFSVLILFSDNMKAQDNMGNPIPQFLFPSFNEGIILFKDGSRVKMLLDYNMDEEMMVTELDGVYRYSKDPKEIDTIYLEKRIFVPIGNIFYDLLAKGPVPFFLQNKCTITAKGTDVGYGVKSQSVGPTKYQRFELTSVVYQYSEVVHIELPPNVEITPASVFWVMKDGKMEKFSNERQFLKIFPEKGSVLKEYIKKQKLNLKRRNDVIKLGAYCNELFR